MKFSQKQRFSIRKYSVGVASVLLGTTLVGTAISTQQVNAENTVEVTSTRSELTSLETSSTSVNMSAETTRKVDENTIETKEDTSKKSTDENLNSEKVTEPAGIVKHATTIHNVSLEEVGEAGSAPRRRVLRSAGQLPNGYTTEKPVDAPYKDQVEGRYTFQVVKSENKDIGKEDGLPKANAAQQVPTYYVFSVSDGDPVNADGSPTKYYVTRYRNNKIISTDVVDANTPKENIKKYDDSVTLSLAPGTSPQLQLNTGTNFGAFLTVYNTLIPVKTVPATATLNGSTPRKSNQVTKFLDNRTGEVIETQIQQNNWNGYKYTTKPIDIQGYDYVRSTDNVNGTISSNKPRNKGNIVTQKAVTTMKMGNEVPQATFYIKREYIDDAQTLKMTVYMSPRVNDGEEESADTFFANIDNYTTTEKVYTPVTDLTQISDNGLKFSDMADNDRNKYYKVRLRPTTNGTNYTDWIKQTSEPILKVGETARFFVGVMGEDQIKTGNMVSLLNLNNTKSVSSEVVYYYEPVGEVKVNYVDTEGNVLQPQAIDTDKQVIYEPNDPVRNKVYDTKDKKPATIEKDGKTYELVPAGDYAVGTVGDQHTLTATKNNVSLGIDTETGELKVGTREVTYVYRLKEDKKGSVEVSYVDTDGHTLKEAYEDTVDAPVGTNYDTTEVANNEKPATIEKDGKVYELAPAGAYPVGTVSENSNLTEVGENGDPKNPWGIDTPTGKVEERTKRVTYVYKLKELKGNVIVKYVNENGETIQPDYEDTPLSPVGTAYDTNETQREKPNRIAMVDGKVYQLVPNKTADTNGKVVNGAPKEIGTVVEGTTTVTYVYKEIKGNVTVSYVDTEGNKLKTDYQDTTDASLGTVYDTTETAKNEKPETIIKDGKTYELVPIGDYAVGKVGPNSHLMETTNQSLGVDAPVGQVGEGTKRVTYVYKLKEEPKGKVVIKYVDETGTPIKDEREDTPLSPVDTPYNTGENESEKPSRIEKDGKVYELVPNKTTDENGKVIDGTPQENGKVVEGTTTVTYVYKEVKGNVTVSYVDTEGNKLKTDYQDTINASLGTAYDTTEVANDEKPTMITKDGKVYVLAPADDYTVGKVGADGHLVETTNQNLGVDAPMGQVEKGTKRVTYVYKLKETPAPKGNVVIKYVDETGIPIKDEREDTPLSPVDTPYNTGENESEKPSRIEKDGKVYELVPNKTTDGNGKVIDGTPQESGKVVEGTTTVTYVYKEVKGNVTVSYVDTDGNPLQPDYQDTINAPLGTNYNTNEVEKDEKPATITKDGKVYVLAPADDYTVGKVGADGHLVETTNQNLGVDAPMGQVEKGTKRVTYVYKLKEEPKGKVVIKYVDEAGTPIKDEREDTPLSPVDTPYNTGENESEKPSRIEKDGKVYELVPNKTTDGNGKVIDGTPQESGKVVEGTTTVTYVYKEVKGNVTVSYVDTEGNKLKTDYQDTINAPLGTNYNTNEVEKDEKPATITKDGKVYVLAPADDYTVGKVGADGHLVETTNQNLGVDAPMGQVEKGTKRVTYVYKLKEEPKGKVVIKYVDETGTPIKDEREDTPLSPVDTPYNTGENESEKPSRIEKDGKVYELVPNKTTDENGKVIDGTPQESGKVVEGITTVTYVYKEVKPKGSVEINYVDTKGNIIKDTVKDTTDAIVGTDYNANEADERPSIIEKDGKRYQLVSAGNYPVGQVDANGHLTNSNDIIGKVEKGLKSVTYVYRELGSYIPYIPTDPGRHIPKVPYDNTPEEPKDNPPLPYIPGYKPELPLVPVDPNDVTKGYIPPTITDPNDPSKDTPVPYVPVKPENPKSEDPKSEDPKSEGPKQEKPRLEVPKSEKSKTKKATSKKDKAINAELPYTGSATNNQAMPLGMLGLLSALGILSRRLKHKKED